MGPGAVVARELSAGRDNIVIGTLIQQGASAAHVSPLHQLPPPPANFTGRDDELAELEKKLTTDHAAGATISGKPHAGLQGMGGVGKTALATMLAHRLKDRYPDAQLYLNLRGADPDHRPPVTPVEAMQILIHVFQPEARLPDTLDQLTPLYHSVLNDAGRVLLLLDNAAAADQVRPLLPPANCLLIVTSRAQFQLPGLAPRNIDCLPPAKAQELLLKLSSRFNGDAKEAAELCGHLPLALEVFAGAVNDRKLYPVRELLDRLRAGKDNLGPVDAAFQLSYDLLADDLRRRWTLLAVFPASFDLNAAAAVWDEGSRAGSPLPAAGAQTDERRARSDAPNQARDAMQALVNTSLVEFNATNGRFRLHDLVRQFCDGKLDEAGRTAAQLRHARHYCSVGAAADKLYELGRENVRLGLELFDRERTHLVAAFDWLQARRDQETAALLVELVDAVVYTGNLRFHPRQLVRWLEGQLAAARITKNRGAESYALGNLGNAYFDLGNARKAIEFYEQCLKLHREIGDRRGEGAALGNLGVVYAVLGDARKAIEFQEQALVIDREIGDRRGEGNDLWNSALALDQSGDRAQAMVRAEEALRIFEAIEDPNAAKVHARLAKWRGK